MKLKSVFHFLFVIVVSWTQTPRVSGVEITIHAPANDYTLIAIPTNIVGGITLANLFKGAAPGTSLIRGKPYAFDQTTYDPDIGDWTFPLLSAGGVYWLYSPFGYPPQTFTWQISGPPVPVTPVNLRSNVYLFLGSINGGTNYEDFVGAQPANDTALFRHIPGPADSPCWWTRMNQYVYLNGAWSPSTPAINPGEGVLVVYPALRLTSTPVTNSPAGFFLSWPRGKLQASDTLNGPWETLTNTGPFRVNTEIQPASSKFYRVDESWDDALFGYPSGHPY